MEKSELQLARAAYLPKLPKGLQGNVMVKEGAPTQSMSYKLYRNRMMSQSDRSSSHHR